MKRTFPTGTTDVVETTPTPQAKAVAEQALADVQRRLHAFDLGLRLRWFECWPLVGVDGFHRNGPPRDNLRELWIRASQPLSTIPFIVAHEASHAFGCLVLDAGRSLVTEDICNAFANGDGRDLMLLYARHELRKLLATIQIVVPETGRGGHASDTNQRAENEGAEVQPTGANDYVFCVTTQPSSTWRVAASTWTSAQHRDRDGGQRWQA